MNADRRQSASRGAWIANPRDFYGALGLLLLALFMLWGMWDLPGTRGFQLGAGSVPRLFAALLAVNALIVMAGAAFQRGPGIQYSLPAALVFAALGGFWFAANMIIGPEGATGAAIAAAFVSLKSPQVRELRGPIFVALGILAFAFFIKPLGLLISVFALVAVSSAASREYRPVESLAWALALSLFSTALFSLVLNVPISVLPKFLLS
jgi:putative tricarboxylic transport membrane protein